MQSCFYYNLYTGTRTWTLINVNPAFLGSWDHKSWLTVFQQHHWNKQQNSSRQQQLQRDMNRQISSTTAAAACHRYEWCVVWPALTSSEICSTVPMILLFSPSYLNYLYLHLRRCHQKPPHIMGLRCGEVAEDQRLMQQSTIQLQNNVYRRLDAAAR